MRFCLTEIHHSLAKSAVPPLSCEGFFLSHTFGLGIIWTAERWIKSVLDRIYEQKIYIVFAIYVREAVKKLTLLEMYQDRNAWFVILYQGRGVRE